MPPAQPPAARMRPCTWYGPTGTCGATPARLYLAGWRCPAHTPAALAGQPEPGAGRSCPPALCWCGSCSPHRTPASAQPARPPVVQAKALPGLAIALQLARLGWQILPLSAASKRPLANCPSCRDTPAGPPHQIEDCPCLPAGRWCHGVRAATTDRDRLATWWQAEPTAVPGVAAGPSGLVLLDIDAHHDQLPADLATGLLPGIDLTAEPIDRHRWADPAGLRDGRNTLRLLAAIRGGPAPWPPGPEHRPLTVATPSGGRHLWYLAPSPGLRQALSDPHGRYGLAWQVDIKAGWSYGLAPGATTTAGTYRVTSGDPARPGHMPVWLAREIARVAGPRPAPARPALPAAARPGQAGARYLATVINRGAARLIALGDGRKRALAALAYQAGGLLAWSGLPEHEVTGWLTDAGTASGLQAATARRIVTRSLANGLAKPITPPSASGRTDRAA
jgi:Bifunctional DNA primase/polymerase, N-terminal